MKTKKTCHQLTRTKNNSKRYFFRPKENDQDRKIKMQEKMRKVNFWLN